MKRSDDTTSSVDETQKKGGEGPGLSERRRYELGGRKRGTTVGIGLGLLVLVILAEIWRVGGVLRPQTSQAAHPRPVLRTRSLSPTPHRLRQVTTAGQAATTTLPWGIAVDQAHGFVWVAEPGCEPLFTCRSAFPGIIGQYSFIDGRFIRDFQEPANFSSPLFIVVDTSGHLWFTEPNSDAIGELDPHTASWRQWGVKRGSMPYDLVMDRNGNLWFTELKGNSIGFLNPHTSTLVETSTPTPKSNPYGITADAQGNIWFSENGDGVGQIGFFQPFSSGIATIVEYKGPVQRPHLITTDSAGNVWFSGGFEGVIGEFNPVSRVNRSIVVTSDICPNLHTCYNTHISGIAVDQSGKVWFTDSLSQRVGYLVPASGKVTVKMLSMKNAHPYDGLAIDSNGTIWFTEQDILQLAMWPAGMPI